MKAPRLKSWLSGLLVVQLALPAWLWPVPAQAAGENISFVGSPKYVRVNSAGDLAAQVITTNTTDSVDFFVDGNYVLTQSTVTAGAATGYEWYRLYTPLPAGEHTITAVANFSGGTVSSSNSGIVYSLDLPTASYVIPSATTTIFRPGDNPLRIRAEDEFNQFKQAVFTIYNGSTPVATHTVLRAACDLRAAGQYVLCDVNQSPTWSALPEGNYTAKVTTYTQANNRADNVPSPAFTVDGSRPTLSNFTIDLPTGVSVYQNLITVSANAADISGIKQVDFWVTEPESRPSGPVCTGNGTALTSETATTTDLDGKYRAALTTSALNGLYCLNAQAADLGNSHSLPILRLPVLIDNSNPSTTLSSPASNLLTNDPITISGSSADNQAVASVHLSYKLSTDSAWTSLTTLNNPTPGTPWSWSHVWTPAADGTYDIKAAAEDMAGNVETSAYASNITYDTTAPDVALTNPTAGPVKGIVDVRGTVTDLNPHHYYLVVKNSSNSIVAGPGTVNESSSFTDSSLFSWDTTLVPDGNYTITLAARDAADNRDAGSMALVIVTVDNTAPTLSGISVISDNANNTTAKVGDQVTVSFTVSEALGATPSVTLGGQMMSQQALNGLTYTFTRTLTGTETEGPTSPIVISGTDVVGNPFTDSSASFSLDFTSPAVTILTPTSDPTYQTSLAVLTITGTASDDQQLDSLSSSPTGVTGTTAWTHNNVTLNEGANVFTYTATDAAGNVGEDTITINRDTTIPVFSSISITSNSPGSSSAGKTGDTVTLTFTTSEVLAGSPTVTIGGQAMTFQGLSGNLYTYTRVINGNEAEGPAVPVFISGQDLLGNPGFGTVMFRLDFTAPLTSLSGPSSNIFVNAPLGISGTSTDLTAVSAVRLYYSPAGENSWTLITTLTNPTPGIVFNWSHNWTPTDEGSYDLKAAATDLLGNEEHSAYARNVTYDKTAPAIAETQILKNGTPAGALTVGENVTIRVRVTDSSGLKSLVSTVENSANGKSLGPVTLNSVGGGWYEGSFTVPSTYTDGSAVASSDGRWAVGATDQAGNYAVKWADFTLRPAATSTVSPSTASATAASTPIRTSVATANQGSATEAPIVEESIQASIAAAADNLLDTAPEVAGTSTEQNGVNTSGKPQWIWWLLAVGILGAGYWIWSRRSTSGTTASY